jgi:cytochrome P450 family 2 subfamily U polypeptide 1
MIIELLLFFLALVVAWNYLGKRDQNFPPGPISLPFLGHLPLMGRFPHKTLCQWRKTYGPIIGVWFGSYKAVAINETKLIREALNMNSFAGRPRLNFFQGKSVDGCDRG